MITIAIEKEILTSRKSLLSSQSTELFLTETHQALLQFRYQTIISVLEKYNLIDKNESMIELIEILKKNTMSKNDTIIFKKEITPYNSTCFGCDFGCNVNAYKVLSYFCDLCITENFAIKFEIKDNCLMDITWCNAFSKKEDIENGLLISKD
jgi:hypothetical protein